MADCNVIAEESPEMPEHLLDWTGHPLADVGVATICAMVGKTNPHEVTLEDLDKVGTELRSAYSDSVFVSYLSCVYMNAPYTNPTIGHAARDKSLARVRPMKEPRDITAFSPA